MGWPQYTYTGFYALILFTTLCSAWKKDTTEAWKTWSIQFTFQVTKPLQSIIRLNSAQFMGLLSVVRAKEIY